MSSNAEENPSAETSQEDGDPSSVRNEEDDFLNNFINLRVSLDKKLDQLQVLLSDIPEESKKLCETFRKSKHSKQEVDLANKVVEWSRLLTNHSTPCQFSPCGGNNCKLCEYVKPTHFVRSKAGKVFAIQEDMDCNSTNLIYLMTCLNADCGMQYVGQTVCKLKKRMNEHRCASKNNAKEEVKSKTTKNEKEDVNQHFAQKDHKPQVCGIVKIKDSGYADYNAKDFRDAVESYLMQPECFNTLGENGLNINASHTAFSKDSKTTEAERKKLIKFVKEFLNGFLPQ